VGESSESEPQAHASLIQDYKWAELGSQDPDAVIYAPAAPAAEQAPQATTPLLVPPLNKLAQMEAARALVENAENAQEGRGAERELFKEFKEFLICAVITS